MQETLHLKGIWFLPDHRDDICPGELFFDANKGISLQLLGRFEESSAHDLHELEIINGISEDGKKITLLTCGQTGSTFNTASFETISYDALYVFIGRTCLNAADLHFTHIRCVFAELGKWLGKTGFSYPTSTNDTYTINYTLPDPAIYSMAESSTMQFRYFYDRNQSGNTKIELDERCAVMISYTKAQPFLKMMKDFDSIHRFLTLAYFQRPLMIQLMVGDKKHSGETEYYNEVQVYFQTDTTTDNYRERRSRHYFLFHYKDIEASFSTILERWLHAEQMMAPTLSSLTEAFMRRGSPVEFTFLNLAQGLETFHRRACDQGAGADEGHRLKIDSILGSVQKEYKDWLEKKLEYSHEPSFKARLKDLASMVPEKVKAKVFMPSESKFLNLIRDNRNYYTHYNPDLKSRSLAGSELFMLSERMKLFLICVVLRHLGFTNEQIVTAICVRGQYLFNHVV